MDKVRFLILLILIGLPNRVKIYLYNKLFGHEIDSSARIGLSFLSAQKIKIGARVSIGHGNIVRGLGTFEVREDAVIGSFNYFSALPKGSTQHFVTEDSRCPDFILGRHSAIVQRHFFDCSNEVRIGDYTTVSGRGSVFFTHGINIERNRQETARIEIGNYCMIATKSVVTKGAVLPDCSVLAANSTLHKAFTEPYTLYSGVPAAAVKTFDKDAAYFKRDTGYVA